MALELDWLQAIWRDLAERVDALAAERQQYLDFFEQAAEAYLVTDAAGAIVDANGAAVDILQRRRRSLRGKPLPAMVALDNRAQFRERLRRLYSGDPAAERSWRAVFEVPGERIEVTLTGRLMGEAARPTGICWLLQADA